MILKSVPAGVLAAGLLLPSAAMAAPGGFADPVALPGTTGTRDAPSVAVNRAGDTALAWEDRRPASRRSVMVARRRGGGEFSAPVRVSRRGRDAIGGITAGVARDGTTFVVWTQDVQVRDPQGGRKRMVRLMSAAAPRGGRFSPPRMVVQGAAAIHAFRPMLAPLGGSRAALAWAVPRRAGGVELRLYTGTRRGRFTRPIRVATRGTPTALVGLDDGSVQIGWSVRGTTLQTARIGARARRPGRARTLTKRATGPLHLAASGSTVAAAWPSAGSKRITVRRIEPRAGSPATVAATSVIEAFGRLAIGADGSSVMPWTEDPTGGAANPIRVAAGRLGGRLSSPDELTSGNQGAIGSAPFAAIASDGSALVLAGVAAASGRPSHLLVAVRAPDASEFTVEPVAAPLRALAFDAAGDAMVAGWKDANGRVHAMVRESAAAANSRR